MRGARLSARHHLANATLHRAMAPPPPSFFRLSQVLLGYGNAPDNTYSGPLYGDCVGAEEFTAKAAHGYHGTDAQAIAAGAAWGTLNGADLATILDEAATTPYSVGPTLVRDGPKQAVNYLDWTALTAAIVVDQVKIAISAQQTEDAGAGTGRVWYLLSAEQDDNIDHCVGIAGFGTLAECCDALHVLTPPEADPTTPCVIIEEWADGDTSVMGSGGYGVASFPALLAIMGSTPTEGNSEAWIRVPNTIVVAPAPSPTPPPPSPRPCTREDLQAALKVLVGALTKLVAPLLLVAILAAARHAQCSSCPGGYCPARIVYTHPLTPPPLPAPVPAVPNEAAASPRQGLAPVSECADWAQRHRPTPVRRLVQWLRSRR